MFAFAPVPDPPQAPRDVLWEHCRNNLGIARLLLHERRPAALVSTACRMAVETGCRAALEQAGLPFEGLDAALERLDAPADLCRSFEPGPGALRDTERAVSWLAAWLRQQAPERAWGF